MVERREAKHRRTLGLDSARMAPALVAVAVFLFWASLYVYVPLLPVHAESLGASLSMVGIIVAAYSIAQVALRIPIGVWADALGRRKPFAVAGMLIAALGGLGLGLSPSPWLLFVSRAATGVAAATWVASIVLFASYYSPERVPKAMGTIMAVNGFALLAASLAGGVVAQVWDTAATFFVSAGIGLLGLLLLLPVGEPVAAVRRSYSYRDFWRVAGAPLLLASSAIAALSQFVSFSTSFGFIPVYGADIGASRAALGYIIATMFAFSTVGSLVYVRVGERLGYRHAIALGSLVTLAAMVATPFIHSVPLLAASQAASGFSRGLQGAALAALSIRAVAPDERATAVGVYQALYSIGMLAGPLLSGFVADSAGVSSVFYLCAGVALVGTTLAYLPVVPAR